MKSLTLLVPVLLLAFAASSHAARPNVIAIVTDDQARWSIGAYGNKESITPNMDRLAREGATFLNAFVNTPVCSPSRAGYLTGLHGTQIGITDWINMNEADAGVGLPPETITWPQVLQQNGYATALIGKWHLGHLPPHHPIKHGYDHFWGILGGGARPMDPNNIEVDGKRTELKGPIPDLLTDETIRWIEANRGKPFAVSMHFREPHLPYTPVPEEDSSPFNDLDSTIPNVKVLEPNFTKQLYREYYGSIHAIDRNLGRLLARLDELGLTENTIVMFTSDHGYNVGHHAVHGKGNGNWIGGGVNGPKRPNMFEQSIRVPLLLRWPASVKPGTRIKPSVTNLDTFASILGMLNIAPPAPAPTQHKQNGRDFSALLSGEIPTDWPAETFGQYDLHNGGLAFMRMIRTDEWKLVRHHLSNGQNELYNLKEDPGEASNRYYDKTAFATRDDLQKRLTAWQQSIDDPVLKLDADRSVEPGPPVGQ